MNKIVTLKTDFKIQALEKVDNLSPYQIIQALLTQGYEDFILIDPHIKQLAGEIILPIENEID